jgi:hypothetical protein
LSQTLRGVGDSRRLGLSIVAIDIGENMPEARSTSPLAEKE